MLLTKPLKPVAIALLMVITGACARVPQSGVNVKPLTTELVFGVPEVTKDAPPPNVITVEDKPVATAPPTPTPALRPKAAPPKVDCPEAGPTAFPKQAATTSVLGQPKPGNYEFRIEGTQAVPQIGNVPLPRVIVKQVKLLDKGQAKAKFTVTEREVVFGSQDIVTQTFEAREIQDAIETNDGIFLTKIDRRTGSDGPIRTFDPEPDIRILPLPVEIGQPPVAAGAPPQPQLNSTGVDPDSLEALRHVGTVTQRRAVDACGEVVQGFFVDVTQEFVSSAGTTRRNFDYAIATQLGGIIIFEHVESPCASESEGKCSPAGSLIFDSRIGQLEPR